MAVSQMAFATHLSFSLLLPNESQCSEKQGHLVDHYLLTKKLVESQ